MIHHQNTPSISANVFCTQSTCQQSEYSGDTNVHFVDSQIVWLNGLDCSAINKVATEAVSNRRRKKRDPDGY